MDIQSVFRLAEGTGRIDVNLVAFREDRLADWTGSFSAAACLAASGSTELEPGSGPDHEPVDGDVGMAGHREHRDRERVATGGAEGVAE